MFSADGSRVEQKMPSKIKSVVPAQFAGADIRKVVDLTIENFMKSRGNASERGSRTDTPGKRRSGRTRKQTQLFNKDYNDTNNDDSEQEERREAEKLKRDGNQIRVRVNVGGGQQRQKEQKQSPKKSELNGQSGPICKCKGRPHFGH